MKLHDAVRELRRQLGWTQRRLADELRKSPHTVKRWEMGIRKPSSELCEKMADLSPEPDLTFYFLKQAGYSGGVDIGRVSGGAGRHYETARRAIDILAEAAAQGSDFAKAELARFAEQLLERAGHAERLLRAAQAERPLKVEAKEWPEVRVVTREEWRRGTEDRVRYQVQVPVLADAAAAGTGREILDADIESFIAIPARVARKGPGKYIGIYARGRSMEPVIADGGIAVIDPESRDILALRGRLVAAKTEDGVVIKRLSRDSRRDRVVLHSENPAFGDIILERLTYNPVIGEVVFLWGAPAGARA